LRISVSAQAEEECKEQVSFDAALPCMKLELCAQRDALRGTEPSAGRGGSGAEICRTPGQWS